MVNYEMKSDHNKNTILRMNECIGHESAFTEITWSLFVSCNLTMMQDANSWIMHIMQCKKIKWDAHANQLIWTFSILNENDSFIHPNQKHGNGNVNPNFSPGKISNVKWMYGLRGILRHVIFLHFCTGFADNAVLLYACLENMPLMPFKCNEFLELLKIKSRMLGFIYKMLLAYAFSFLLTRCNVRENERKIITLHEVDQQKNYCILHRFHVWNLCFFFCLWLRRMA